MTGEQREWYVIFEWVGASGKEMSSTHRVRATFLEHAAVKAVDDYVRLQNNIDYEEARLRAVEGGLYLKPARHVDKCPHASIIEDRWCRMCGADVPRS